MLILSCLAFRLSAQDNITFSCSYTGSGAVLTAHGFETDDLESDPSISDLVKQILKLHHVPSQKIQVQVSSEVNNASAAARGGRPYILYSSHFVKNLQSLPHGSWKLMGIFAHEVGHHLLFHTMAQSKSRPDLELEADTWAGSTLYQLGATLEQALSCFESVSMNGTSTHPPRNERKQAMEKGWYEAKAANPAPAPVPKPAPAPAPSPAKRDFTETATGASFAMKYLSGNSFSMGSEESDAYSDEKPVHTVRVGAFYMGKYEVTFAEYDRFCDATSRQKPSDQGWGRGNRPVINVSWDDAVAYCQWLSNTTGKTYRLPTEAEWEYSARGGENYKYAGSNDVNTTAWNTTNSDSKTHPVGQKQANGFGLYDMAGNVWEWCSDYYSDYNSNSQSNPIGAASGSNRVLRGGRWGSVAQNCRVLSRNNRTPADRDDGLGFRVVCLSQ